MLHNIHAIIIPIWIVAGLGAVLVSAAMPLLQERFKADGGGLAYWNKIFTVLLALPFVFHDGLPRNGVFYGLTAASALLWCGGDVVYFRALPVVGAAVVTRLVPVALIGTFLLWFAVDPALLQHYIARPGLGLGVSAIMIAAAFFAFRLKNCAVTWRAARLIWPLLLAAAVGPIVQKIALAHGGGKITTYSFVLVQALMMLGFWSLFRLAGALKSAGGSFHSARTIGVAAVISVFSAGGMVLQNIALQHVEHPAYLSVLILLNSVLVLGWHRLTGRRDGSNAAAGFGLVACAAALLIVKSFA